VTNEGRPRILEVKGVTKRFGEFVVLKDVSFAMRQGEILGLIGPNGAGKTMLVNLISGNIPLSSGDVHFLGKSIRGFKPHEIGSLGISWTSQIVQPITDMTTLENVMVGALFGNTERKRTVQAARKKAEETLALLGLSAKKDVQGEKLNIQERKRLERARALAMLPKVLLLDEVLAGLNSTEMIEGIDLIKKVRDAGVTILVIEHSMKAIASMCDRVVVLQSGEKIAEGTSEEVLHDDRVIDAYLGKRYRALLNSSQQAVSGRN
jgi:branched-chain amino acid transport system ATP-binding protein